MCALLESDWLKEPVNYIEFCRKWPSLAQENSWWLCNVVMKGWKSEFEKVQSGEVVAVWECMAIGAGYLEGT